jgi:mono/diheme cytochrome c family protein
MSDSLGALFVLIVACALTACHHPSASTETEANQSGEQIFGSICAKCHGADGKGGIAAGGANPPRNFCDSAFQASRSDDDLKQVIQKGKGGMPAFGTMFSDSDLQGLVHKLRSFDPARAAARVDPSKGH